jgi:hypothetical protein
LLAQHLIDIFYFENNLFCFSCRPLDNQSVSSSTDTRSTRLVNSGSSKSSKPSSPTKRDHLSLRHADSCASISSEKVSLMTGSEQSSVVQPLLTDLYQISMAYAYWKGNKHQEIAVFDLYFRKNRK